MARDGEHFFMCFWPFGLLSLKKFCLRQINSIRRIIKTVSANRKKTETESINLKP
jgi:hypothetical protein